MTNEIIGGDDVASSDSEPDESREIVITIEVAGVLTREQAEEIARSISGDDF